MKKNYEKWNAEILKTLTELKEKIDNNPKSKVLYGGFYVFDSKYISKPDFLFIGINPGNGNPNNSGKIITEPENQFSYIEYMDGENESYTLAKETIEAFEMAGFSTKEIRNILNNKSVKTNFYYLITTKIEDIKKCINNIDNYSFNEFYKYSYKWTVELISMIEPKIIICEGKSTFDEIKDNDDIKKIEWKNDCGYLIRPNGQIIIGYSRTYSHIKNKQELSKLITKFYKNNENEKN